MGHNKFFDASELSWLDFLISIASNNLFLYKTIYAGLEILTLKNLDDKMEKLNDKMDLVRSELGNVYESSARLEIAKINGYHYSSKFEISDLIGLVRLSLPRKKFSNETKIRFFNIYSSILCQ